MKRIIFLSTTVSAMLIVASLFVGGGGPGLSPSAVAGIATDQPALAVAPASQVAEQVVIDDRPRVNEVELQRQADELAKSLTTDYEHLAQKVVPKPLPPVSASGAASGTNERRAAYEAQGLSCPNQGGTANSGAPGASSALGVAGTTSGDLASFAAQYNAIRFANCLPPVNYFVYDSCMEARLFWMAESPSPNPLDAWGHMGSVRIDGAPSVGCDGNLAGGSGNSGATVAQKWWDSSGHRASLYRVNSGTGGVCIAFAMTHGGIDEPYSFTRAAARWTSC